MLVLRGDSSELGMRRLGLGSGRIRERNCLLWVEGKRDSESENWIHTVMKSVEV